LCVLRVLDCARKCIVEPAPVKGFRGMALEMLKNQGFCS
jgi:hypothetical protein